MDRRLHAVVCVRVCHYAYAGGGLCSPENVVVPACGDGDYEATGALDRGVFDQWIGNRGHSGGEHALLARSLAPAHHGLALLAHYGENVGKIEIDQTFLDYKVADAGHTRIKHLIGQGKGIGECGLLVGHPEQVLVWDDQQGVHHLHQFRDAGFGKPHSALAFEVEGLGNYPHGANAKLTRGPGDNRSCSGSGTAAHAGSNEHHVCAGQLIADCIDCLFGCGAPHFGCEPAPRPWVTRVPNWMMRLAFEVASACASVLATMKSTPCSPAAIMLLTALPPAPPTPNTIMRAFISRISVMLVIFASRLLRQEEDTDLLPTCLAVCFHYGRG